MAFHAIATQRLYQQVAEQLATLIGAGELAPGARLPAERELARELQVSRPVLREAMVALEIAGLVEVRTGSGAYVVRPPSESPSIVEGGPSLFAIVAARRAVEGEVAFLAAQAPPDADAIRTLRELIVAQKNAVAADETGHAEDERFHATLAAMTGNEVLESIVARLWTDMMTAIFVRLTRRSDGPRKVRRNSADHTAIMNAVERRDPEAARRAMQTHIEHTEKWFLIESRNEETRPRKAAPSRTARAKTTVPPREASS